nr:hypothetical protein Q903MT_gene2223 [Picea sitchensis]
MDYGAPLEVGNSMNGGTAVPSFHSSMATLNSWRPCLTTGDRRLNGSFSLNKMDERPSNWT